MLKGYVAGPMRGIPLLNFPAFDAAAAKGRSLGYDIISPADMDRENGVSGKEPLNADDLTPAMIREFVLRDTNVIQNVLRAEDGDFLALLPNWYKSKGATAEVFLARWLGLAFKDAHSFEPWPLMPDGVPYPTPQLHPICHTGDCSIERDLATTSTIIIANDFANRKEL